MDPEIDMEFKGNFKGQFKKRLSFGNDCFKDLILLVVGQKHQCIKIITPQLVATEMSDINSPGLGTGFETTSEDLNFKDKPTPQYI